MPFNPENMMLGVVAVIVVTGLLLVRSARRSKPPAGPHRPPAPPDEPERICSNENCRHPNPARAAYCSQCGRRLLDART